MAEKKIGAPLPGTVRKINVSVGQSVAVGDNIIIIEAMKMQNEIASTASGVVKEICVSEGQSVRAGAPLIILE